MRSTVAVIDQTGTGWWTNNRKSNIDVDPGPNPCGDG
jgi:hypothetical protein